MPEKTITNMQVGMGAVVLILLLVLKEVVKKTFARFFEKTIETDYVTTDQCEKNRAEIKEQTDYKIETSKNETHRMLKEINTSIGFQNDHLEVMNENLVIGIMNNTSLTEEQKQKSVIDLSTRKKK